MFTTLAAAFPSRSRAAAVLAALSIGAAVQAAPVSGAFSFDEFGGPNSPAMSGGLLFSPVEGIGGWIGKLHTDVLPGLGSAVFDTLVTFAGTSMGGGFRIVGDFTFTFDDVGGLTPDDDRLVGTLVGDLLLPGVDDDPDVMRVLLDYSVTGGAGLFAGFTGLGTSVFSYSVVGGEPFSYAGAGQLRLVGPVQVPVPGTLALAALGLVAAARVRRSAPGVRALR